VEAEGLEEADEEETEGDTGVGGLIWRCRKDCQRSVFALGPGGGGGGRLAPEKTHLVTPQKVCLLADRCSPFQPEPSH